ncbi:GlsB/YeaQ/YmgE family stress response membrane protein [Micromonospora sp. NPDC023644]|uniref:GlsB/YeaQ/YmgE family stress response membrane protein n=1 Tax=Micromonospora sp. NPDC023644 TaxID=3154321 RepID=UPI0033FDDEC3
MTVSALVSAIVVSLVAGALGRPAVPARDAIPRWLALVLGVTTALLATILAVLVGVDARNIGLLGVVGQAGCAGLAVILVAIGAGRRQPSR